MCLHMVADSSLRSYLHVVISYNFPTISAGIFVAYLTISETKLLQKITKCCTMFHTCYKM